MTSETDKCEFVREMRETSLVSPRADNGLDGETVIVVF